ncbi:hypothetical protein P3G55_08635 [Leptospira sp. 96542]|nr:hypothetical protein [Leptospira sp. 96542]
MKGFFTILLLIGFLNCNQGKEEDDLLLPLLAYAASRQTTAVQTTCGIVNQGSTSIDFAAGRFDVTNTLRTIDTWESERVNSPVDQLVILFIAGIAANERIRFDFSGSNLADLRTGNTKSTVFSCPFRVADSVSGFDTLGFTRNTAVPNGWFFNASGATPANVTFSISRNIASYGNTTLKVIKENQ